MYDTAFHTFQMHCPDAQSEWTLKIIMDWLYNQ